MNIVKMTDMGLDNIGSSIQKKLNEASVEEFSKIAEKAKKAKKMGNESILDGEKGKKFIDDFTGIHTIGNAATGGGAEGAILGAASGGLLGGVVGGIDDDGTFLEGMAEGAVIGGALGGAGGAISGGIHRNSAILNNARRDLLVAGDMLNGMAKNTQATVEQTTQTINNKMAKAQVEREMTNPKRNNNQAKKAMAYESQGEDRW